MRASLRGFSIIELMVVLVILALLLAAGTPSFIQWMANSRIRTAAESVQNGLRLAASEAVNRNTQVDFVLTSDANPTGDPAASATGTGWVVRIQAMPASELLDSKTATEGSTSVQVAATDAGTGNPVSMIRFSGLGRVVPGDPPVQIAFTNPPNGNRPLNVTVSIGGRIRMCDPSITVANDPRGC
jgi:type IV fimbrial biogenesis protein FimT